MAQALYLQETHCEDNEQQILLSSRDLKAVDDPYGQKSDSTVAHDIDRSIRVPSTC